MLFVADISVYDAAEHKERLRRDSSDEEEGDEEEVFGYVWDVGLPIGDAVAGAYISSSDDDEDDQEESDATDVGDAEYADSDEDTESNCSEAELRSVEVVSYVNDENDVIEDNGAKSGHSERGTEKSVCKQENFTENSVQMLEDNGNTGYSADLEEGASSENVAPRAPPTLVKVNTRIRLLQRSLTASEEKERPLNTRGSRRRILQKSNTTIRKSPSTPRRSRRDKRRHSHAYARASSKKIRHLQRALTGPRDTPREKLSRVLRPPTPSAEEKAASSAAAAGSQAALSDDARYRRLMLPTSELLMPAPTSPPRRRRSEFDGQIRQTLSLPDADTDYEREDSVCSTTSMVTTFRLRSTGFFPWSRQRGANNGGDENANSAGVGGDREEEKGAESKPEEAAHMVSIELVPPKSIEGTACPFSYITDGACVALLFAFAEPVSHRILTKDVPT